MLIAHACFIKQRTIRPHVVLTYAYSRVQGQGSLTHRSVFSTHFVTARSLIKSASVTFHKHSDHSIFLTHHACAPQNRKLQYFKILLTENIVSLLYSQGGINSAHPSISDEVENQLTQKPKLVISRLEIPTIKLVYQGPIQWEKQ